MHKTSTTSQVASQPWSLYNVRIPQHYAVFATTMQPVLNVEVARKYVTKVATEQQQKQRVLRLIS